MRTTRAAHRLDGNHRAIVDALRQVGALVLSLSTLGAGAPDLLVYFRGKLFLMELKVAGALRPAQDAFARLGWPVALVRSIDDALRAVGAVVR